MDQVTASHQPHEAAARSVTAPVSETDPPTAARLWLAPHVRGCRVGDEVVLMDLVRGRYLGLGPMASTGIGSMVGDWPGGLELSPTLTSDPVLMAHRLLQRRLLTRQAPPTALQHKIPRATQSLDVQDLVPVTPVGMADLAGLALANVKAKTWLGCRSLQAHCRAIARRSPPSARPASDSALLQLRKTLAVYEKLRPLLFTARDQCLLDSFTLLHFLTARRLHAQLVIGVRTHPFRAHAWIQRDDLVLNDRHEHVGRFTPIFVL